MINDTIKALRSQKGFKSKELAHQIVSDSQLSKIEKGDKTLDAETFVSFLFRLNTNLEEFFHYSDNARVKARLETTNYIGEILRQRKIEKYPVAIEKMEYYYKKYGDDYFRHNSCLVKAMNTSNMQEAKRHLLPIKSYLNNTKVWLTYELKLLNNILISYSYEDAAELGEKALHQISKNRAIHENSKITYSLLTNLAYSALQHEQPIQACEYANKALNFPYSTDFMYENLLLKIIHQIACYKLENSQFDKEYLTNLITGFKLMRLDDLHAQALNLIDTHNIPFN